MLDYFGVNQEDTAGTSFLGECLSDAEKAPKSSPSSEELTEIAQEMRKRSYVPYSGFSVGAALLTKSGKVYTGCNIENAAYTPTVCAERTAFFKAVSEGEREFSKIAIVGGKSGETADLCPPCGVCRQVMAEFCSPDFIVILGKPGAFREYRLSELLPVSFTPRDLA